MSTYKLTADELLLIYLTFLARDEEGGHNEFLHKWFTGGGSERLRSLFNSLKEKGFIHKSYETTSYEPNEIEFNKTFIKSWTKNSLEMGQELLSAYPISIIINGQNMMLKDVSKRFASLDDFFFFYGTQIGHNPEKHKEVMEILNWAKENGYINFGILSFVISHQWENLKKLRDDPELVPVSQTSIYLDE